MTERSPGPEDVAEALRQGRPPSEVLGEPAGAEAPPGPQADDGDPDAEVDTEVDTEPAPPAEGGPQ